MRTTAVRTIGGAYSQAPDKGLAEIGGQTPAGARPRFFYCTLRIMRSGVSSTRVPCLNSLLSVSTYWMSPPASILMARRLSRSAELLGVPAGSPEAPVAVPPLTDDMAGVSMTDCTQPKPGR